MNENELLIKKLFEGYVDKSNVPYHLHCIFVANKAKEIAQNIGLNDNEIRTVYLCGLLHDVVEDIYGDNPEVGLSFIEENYGSEVKEIVSLLTKQKNEKYNDYIKRVETNPKALIVKFADSLHNSDITRYSLKDITDKQIQKSKEYHKRALGYLKQIKEYYGV